MTQFRFTQVDVFGSGPLSGNPVAVVHGADGLSDHQMQALARWTNLSETTFLLEPTDPLADYRLRIFTPSSELPFAGHPTLGSARAWLDAGGVARAGDTVVQECGVGLIEIRRDGDSFAFVAPPLRRSGPLDVEERAAVLAALGLRDEAVGFVEWLDNGPHWIGVHLASAEAVLAVETNYELLGPRFVGMIGPHDADGPAMFEVRAVAGDINAEDPVTGSLNAGFAVAMYGDGRVDGPITVRQGTRVGAAGDVVWSRGDDGRVWIGGSTAPVVTGTIDL